MADVSVESARRKKKKKRKLSSNEDDKRPNKTHRVNLPDNEPEPEPEPEPAPAEVEPDQKLEEERPWRNLKLILSIQNKEIDIQKKVELVFSFVNSKVKGGGSDENEDYETVKTSRLIVFLSDWIQSLLISTEKKVKVDGGRNQSGAINACLDFRCWVIFKFCLEESLKWHVSLSMSRNLLRAISCIARDALSLLNENSMDLKESLFVGEGFELYTTALGCVSSVFSSQGGFLNENLDLWISTVHPVLELVLKIYSLNMDAGRAADFVMQFSCLVLEPFAQFLKIHPTRKNGFRDFVDKLLEPLLQLLSILQIHVDASSPVWIRNLLKLVEEVLSTGLFHPTHIDGFLGLHNIEKYLTSDNGKLGGSKTVIKSYHRHLFDKLDSIMAAKKISVLSGIGQLFHLLVDRVKKHKGVAALSEGTKMMGKVGASRQLEKYVSGLVSIDPFGNSTTLAEKNYSPSNLSADSRKSLFEFFIQTMEPLLVEMSGYLQAELVEGPPLSDVHCTFKSINTLLASFMHEKVYVRTENISGGACLNFLMKVHDAVMSFASNLPRLSNCDIAHRTQKEMFTYLAQELFAAVGYLLDIEYEVIGHDPVSLWLMVLSYLAIGLSFVDAPGQCLLTTRILDLGCRLVNLFSELRQVNTIIFSLCKAIRLIVSCNDEGETNYTRFLSCTTLLPFEAYTKSVGLLLCSEEFKSSIHNAIRSIPEGQASGCIRQLTADISESLKWMKETCVADDEKELKKLKVRDWSILGFDLQAELWGRDLSEIYALVLDSVIVTAGNSSLLGLSVKDLLTIIRPCISSLIQLRPESLNEFLFSVTGRTFENGVAGNNNDLLKFGLSAQWVFVFFFRLYSSCRNLFRQAISFMPSDISKKMSTEVGDFLTAYSGKDLMEKTDWTNEGYFSWVAQCSNSLIDVIQFVSDIYIKENVAKCCTLIYVFHVMALQRLADLNRQIKSLDYLLQNNDNAIQFKLVDNADLSWYHRKCKKWRKHISVLSEEAAGLADFLMGYVTLVNDKQLVISSSNIVSCEDKCAQELHGSHEWKMGVCAVDEQSLPTAIWWIVSQNIDIWCTHAASKKLKMFLSLLIRTSLPCVKSSNSCVGKQNINDAGCLKRVTLNQISSELLSHSFLYEHKFVRRHLASRFCQLLEQSALSLFSDFSIRNVDFSTSPNWTEVLTELENSSLVVLGNKNMTGDLPAAICERKEAFQFANVKFADCKSLLDLLCWMPKGYLNSRSFSLYATYILNLERIVVSCLFRCQGALSSHCFYDFFRLFVSCRRTLKYIIIASCEDKRGDSLSSQIPIFSGSSDFILWLFKSGLLVIGLQEAISDDCSSEIRDMIFSLMDHTSCVFLTLSKCFLNNAICSSKHFEKPSKEQPNSDIAHEQNNIKESGPFLDSSKYVEAWKSLFLVMESLEEQTQSLLMSLKDVLRDRKFEIHNKAVILNKLSSAVSCYSGIFWGLAYAVNQRVDKKAKLLGWNFEPISKLNLHINVFTDIVSSFLCILVVEDDQPPESSRNAQSSQKLDFCRDSSGGLEEFLHGSCNAMAESLCGKKYQNSGSSRTSSASFNIEENSRMGDLHDSRSHLEDANGPDSVLAEGDLIELQCFNRCLLHGLLKGDHPEAAFSLRQLLMAASAILRLNLLISSTPFSLSLVPRLICISQFLMLQLADITEVPQPFTFVWLDGVLRFLEELGSHFPLTNPTLTRNIYTKLIELHLRVIGKCISLQEKKATLASHETESRTKILDCSTALPKASPSRGSNFLDEFKARLRSSFEVFIKRPSDLHLLSAVQAIERALVGVEEGCTMIYHINTGSGDGGKVSSMVAAGIDCLDLLLENVTGRKRLGVVKRHIQNLIAALFNVVVHLRSPIIFLGKPVNSESNNGPDSGSVILMCIEVLTRVSGKHALFQMDSWHVAQSLRIPGALFQDFQQLRLPQAPVPSTSAMFDNQNSNSVAVRNSWAVDKQFSINLFAACCRLLYTIVKHHKSECEQCIAILEESVCVLLHCLEIVDTDVVRKGYFSWEVQEGVKCASFLRRIYEEVRQQKDVFGRHCYKFLSNYVWIYAGYGSLKAGIRREIDEALRPGVYALIDACSADDLQYLHTVFGEGPCRNTLATLQHDYKLNFQYEGKV